MYIPIELFGVWQLQILSFICLHIQTFCTMYIGMLLLFQIIPLNLIKTFQFN